MLSFSKLPREFLKADLDEGRSSLRAAVGHVAGEEPVGELGDAGGVGGRLKLGSVAGDGGGDGFVVEAALRGSVAGMLEVGDEGTDEGVGIAVAGVERREAVDDDGIGPEFPGADTHEAECFEVRAKEVVFARAERHRQGAEQLLAGYPAGRGPRPRFFKEDAFPRRAVIEDYEALIPLQKPVLVAQRAENTIRNGRRRGRRG
jgi:hypothetical protein